MKFLFFLIAVFFLSFRGSAENYPTDSTTTSLTDSIITPGAESRETLYNRGLEYYSANNFLQAILCIDSCLSLDSSFAEARLIKALSLEKKGELDAAMAEFEKVQGKLRDDAEVDKRLKNYYFTTYLAKNWYYMLAMLLILIILMAIVVKSLSYKKM